MVAAVHYYATADDHADLLDYLGEPSAVSLHPWPVITAPPTVLSRPDALASRHVLIVSRTLGPPTLIRADSNAMSEPTRSGVFNRLNWERLGPGIGEGLVDSNSSPVLLWTPGDSSQPALRESTIGSQANSMGAISDGYERWVNRVMGWVRRRGRKVWGLQGHAIRPDLDLDIQHVSAMYALPHAMAELERGVPGR